MKYIFIILLLSTVSCSLYEFEKIEDEENYPSMFLYIQDFDIFNSIDNSKEGQTIIIEGYSEHSGSPYNDGNYLECDGSGSIKIPSLDLSGFTAFTFSFWIKGYIGRNELLLSQGAINTESDSSFITLKNDKIILGDPNYIIPHELSDALDGDWHMLTITSEEINNSSIQAGYKIYVDSILFSENDQSFLFFDRDSTCTIALDFNGKLDNIRIHNKALSTEDILSFYSKEKGGFSKRVHPFLVSNNLVSYFTFDDESLVDQITNQDAKPFGDVSYTVNPNLDKGYSIKLDEGYIEVESSILGLINSFSLNFWMKSKERNNSLFSQGIGNTDDNEIGIIDGKLHFGNSEFQLDYEFDNVLDEEWHMITIASQRINSGNDASDVHLYIDGKLESSKGMNDLNFNDYKTSPFLIGSDGGTGYFNGYFDNIRLYNKVLDKKEIELIFGQEE